jgi:hypothetical protein
MGRMKEHEVGWATALDATLDWHLRHNIYPPMLEAFPAAREAIALGREGKFGDACPFVRARDGEVVTVQDVIEQLRLEDFLFLGPAEA